MRINEIMINESYAHIIKPLHEITNEILDNISQSVRPNIPITVSNLLSNDFINSMYDKYGSRFGKFSSFVNNIQITLHRENYGKTFASFSVDSYGNSYLNVFLQFIFPTIDYDISLTPTILMNSNKLQSTMIHELRHAMQSQEFKKFFSKHAEKQTSKRDDFDYKTDPIEIDAAFTHIIFETPLDQPINSFVKEVMTKFSEYKTLTSKQIKHYFRSAAKYYTQHKNVYDKDTIQMTPKERLIKRNNDKMNITRQLLMAAIDLKFIPEDLRELGFTGNTFIFDSFYQGRFRGVLNTLLTPENKEEIKQMSSINKAMLAWYLSLLNKSFKNEGRDISDDIKSYFDISNTNMEECIDTLKNTDSSKFKYNKKHSFKLMRELDNDMNNGDKYENR